MLITDLYTTTSTMNSTSKSTENQQILYNGVPLKRLGELEISLRSHLRGRLKRCTCSICHIVEFVPTYTCLLHYGYTCMKIMWVCGAHSTLICRPEFTCSLHVKMCILNCIDTYSSHIQCIQVPRAWWPLSKRYCHITKPPSDAALRMLCWV